MRATFFFIIVFWLVGCTREEMHIVGHDGSFPILEKNGTTIIFYGTVGSVPSEGGEVSGNVYTLTDVEEIYSVLYGMYSRKQMAWIDDKKYLHSIAVPANQYLELENLFKRDTFAIYVHVDRNSEAFSVDLREKNSNLVSSDRMFSIDTSKNIVDFYQK